jgi:hypothetical protein
LFNHLEKVSIKLNSFNRPEAIWNVDGCGFSDDPGSQQLVIKRASKYAIFNQRGAGSNYRNSDNVYSIIFGGLCIIVGQYLFLNFDDY